MFPSLVILLNVLLWTITAVQLRNKGEFDSALLGLLIAVLNAAVLWDMS